jgi:hypothetical protein
LGVGIVAHGGQSMFHIFVECKYVTNYRNILDIGYSCSRHHGTRMNFYKPGKKTPNRERLGFCYWWPNGETSARPEMMWKIADSFGFLQVNESPAMP